MPRSDYIRAFSNWLSEAKVWGDRDRKTECADCPIVMSCGLPPRENCLQRREAMANGEGRRIGPRDTSLTNYTPYMR